MRIQSDAGAEHCGRMLNEIIGYVRSAAAKTNSAALPNEEMSGKFIERGDG